MIALIMSQSSIIIGRYDDEKREREKRESKREEEVRGDYNYFFFIF
jgi:hypothetical protein